jgi:hypothetical protein
MLEIATESWLRVEERGSQRDSWENAISVSLLGESSEFFIVFVHKKGAFRDKILVYSPEH